MAIPKWQSFYKIINPTTDSTKVTDSQNLGSPGLYGNYSWYSKLIQGSSSRLIKYREWDLMDDDIEINRALDTIAEEMTGNNTKTDDALEIDIINSDDTTINNTNIITIKAALDHWIEIHDWHNRLFKIARYVIKYGDLFFNKKDQLSKWSFIHPRNVMAAIVAQDDVTEVRGWQIRKDLNEVKSMYGTPGSGAGTNQQIETEIKEAKEIVRFTLNDDMSDSAPFGDSILKSVYKTHKQKELLEDAIIIYRIQRAPERRVFYIDVGKMPPQRIKQYLEQIKNEIKQKKIPTFNGGKSEIDSVYNPQCIDLETKIPLLDGRTLTLNAIIGEYENGKENWAYSINPDTGESVPGLISWAGITRKNTKSIKITLGNGKELICTPDHKIPVQGKGFMEAKDLTENDSLFPFIKRNKQINDINCRIDNIEEIDNRDTGCITIDENHIHHNYHTFAIDAGIYIKNSMGEDFFLAQKSDGRGSKVETLPGGQGLTSLDDLDYFQNKVFRGLRIPLSYMKQGAEGALFNDGKVGQAYIQELRFSLYIQRLQNIIETVLDKEFKLYLKMVGINIDTTTFKIKLPEPSNFGTYREQEMDAALLNNYGTIDGVPYISKQFAMKRFLKLTDDEIMANERSKIKEMGEDPDNIKDKSIYTRIYAPDVTGMESGEAGGPIDLGTDMMPDSTNAPDLTEPGGQVGPSTT